MSVNQLSNNFQRAGFNNNNNNRTGQRRDYQQQQSYSNQQGRPRVSRSTIEQAEKLKAEARSQKNETPVEINEDDLKVPEKDQRVRSDDVQSVKNIQWRDLGLKVCACEDSDVGSSFHFSDHFVERYLRDGL